MAKTSNPFSAGLPKFPIKPKTAPKARATPTPSATLPRKKPSDANPMFSRGGMAKKRGC